MIKKKKVAEPVKEKVPYVYMGPSFKDSYLKRMMIFKEIPEEYKDDPVYKHLFVKPLEVSRAMDELKKEGTLMHTMYQRAINLHKK